MRSCLNQNIQTVFVFGYKRRIDTQHILAGEFSMFSEQIMHFLSGGKCEYLNMQTTNSCYILAICTEALLTVTLTSNLYSARQRHVEKVCILKGAVQMRWATVGYHFPLEDSITHSASSNLRLRSYWKNKDGGF